MPQSRNPIGTFFPTPSAKFLFEKFPGDYPLCLGPYLKLLEEDPTFQKDGDMISKVISLKIDPCSVLLSSHVLLIAKRALILGTGPLVFEFPWTGHYWR